ncbi:MAG: DUF3467 domain-containing protein [Thermoprotei archaeon]|nr:MAG: DUF3467 domain-containing protein [Thermoprotei archaeon]RLF22833.1 MAG: DUF3467 domain-containing protein [Thermoprotei archaeon]
MSEPKISISKSQDFKQVYVSGATIGHTPYDFHIQFFRDSFEPNEEVFTGKKPPKVTREFVFEVVMSPNQAKALALLLMKHVEDYERKFGKIPTPQTPPTHPPSGYLV